MRRVPLAAGPPVSKGGQPVCANSPNPKPTKQCVTMYLAMNHRIHRTRLHHSVHSALHEIRHTYATASDTTRDYQPNTFAHQRCFAMMATDTAYANVDGATRSTNHSELK